jgi:single-stranded DNA-binding protein
VILSINKLLQAKLSAVLAWRQTVSLKTNKPVQWFKKFVLLTLMFGDLKQKAVTNIFKRVVLFLVEGRLKLDSWQDPDGNKRSKHSIVADRVTFLASGAQDDLEDSASDQADEGFSRSEQPKKAVAPARKAAPKATSPFDAPKGFVSTGEVTLKDEAPFEDDLPF